MGNGRRQKAEGRRQKTEDRRQKTEEKDPSQEEWGKVKGRTQHGVHGDEEVTENNGRTHRCAPTTPGEFPRGTGYRI